MHLEQLLLIKNTKVIFKIYWKVSLTQINLTKNIKGEKINKVNSKILQNRQ